MGESAISAEQVQRFYRTGILGLRALQDRGLGAERFGESAAARWRAFKGELTDSHRLDLLLRDGAVSYPLAFAARAVFDLAGLADDEPFGPEWVSPPPSQAGPLLRDAQSPTSPGAEASASAVVEALADVWQLSTAAPDREQLAGIGPASRIVVAGSGALLAVLKATEAAAGTDFGDQVLLVSRSAGERQLAGLAAALSGSRATPRVLSAAASASDASAAGFERATHCVVSPDAAANVADAARRLAAELMG